MTKLMHGDPVMTAMAAMLDRAVAGIPGLDRAPAHAASHGAPVDIECRADGSLTYQPVFDGWGPAFHVRRMTVHRSITGTSGAALEAEAAALLRLTASQRLLSHRAAVLGIAVPLDIPRHVGWAVADGTVLATLFGHVMADRALLDAIVAHHGRDAAAAELHDHMHGLCAVDGHLEDWAAGDGAGTIAHPDGIPTYWRRTPVGTRGADHDGSAFRMPERLPDTVLRAAVGRPLGRVVATGIASLDAAIVTEAEHLPDDSDGMVCEFTLRPDAVRLADHPVCSREWDPSEPTAAA